MSQAHKQVFQIAINKLFEWLFSRVLNSHRGGPGSIRSWYMSVMGPLVYDGDDLGQSGDLEVIQNTQTCKASARHQAIRLANAVRPSAVHVYSCGSCMFM